MRRTFYILVKWGANIQFLVEKHFRFNYSEDSFRPHIIIYNSLVWKYVNSIKSSKINSGKCDDKMRIKTRAPKLFSAIIKCLMKTVLMKTIAFFEYANLSVVLHVKMQIYLHTGRFNDNCGGFHFITTPSNTLKRALTLPECPSDSNLCQTQ